MLDAVVAIFSAVVGGSFAHFLQRSQSKQQIEAARSAMELERHRAREDRRESYELEQLMRMSETMIRFGRVAQRVFSTTTTSLSIHGTGQLVDVPRSLAAELVAARQEIVGEILLILDDDARALVEDAYQQLVVAAEPKSDSGVEAWSAWGRALTAYNKAQERIAERTRAIYIGELLHASETLVDRSPS